MTISGQIFVSAISLSCSSGLPAASSCAFNPPLAGPGTIADTMTITTTARSAAVGGIDPPLNRLPFLLAMAHLIHRGDRFRSSLPCGKIAQFQAGMGHGRSAIGMRARHSRLRRRITTASYYERHASGLRPDNYYRYQPDKHGFQPGYPHCKIAPVLCLAD